MRISVRSTIPMRINVGDSLPLEENGPMLLESREREEMRKKKKSNSPFFFLSSRDLPLKIVGGKGQWPKDPIFKITQIILLK